MSKINLEKQGIELLTSYFEDDKSKKAIREKFKNISGKTGQYYVPKTLFQQRTARNNRCLIPFSHVVENNLTYEQLNTVENGIVVEFVNNEYFDELNKPEKDQAAIFKQLKNKLGSDDNVSAILDIRSIGDSSSIIQRKALENCIHYIKDNKLDIIDVLLKRKNKPFKNNVKGKGNDKWEGFLYYNICGGQQDSIDSHIQYDIPANTVHLFNPAVEYADSDTSTDITMVLIYFAMFSIPINKRGQKWNELKILYENYFENKEYNNINLLSYVKNHISLQLEKDVLFDPIQVKPINIEDFAISQRNSNALDLTHQNAVNHHSYIFDKSNDKLLTPANPTNLFWSTHLSNMMQQDFSLKDYYINQLKNVEKWKQYGIDNLYL